MPDEPVTLESAMLGILALLAAERDDQISATPLQKRRRTELVLADIGLQPRAIAKMLGKKSNTVATTIRRARNKAGDELDDG